MKNKITITFGLIFLIFAIPHAAFACGVQGYVFCDANSNGILDYGDFGIPNVTVKLFRDGVLYRILQTDVGGFYTNWAPAGTLVEAVVDVTDPDLPADAMITTPASYAFPNICSSTLINVANFGFFSEDCLCPPCADYPVKTQGYWKHNICYWADPPENNGYQEELADMESALTQINATWWNPNFGEDLTMQTACDVMQLAQGSSPCNKAKAQLLALLFNVARFYVTPDVSISSPYASTVGEAITQCFAWILGGTYCKEAQELANSINEGSAFGASDTMSAPTGGGIDQPSYNPGDTFKKR